MSEKTDPRTSCDSSRYQLLPADDDDHITHPISIHVLPRSASFDSIKTIPEPVQHAETALGNVTLLAIYSVIISDSIALTVMTPFITQYCREWLHLGESSIDTASGWLLGSFSFAVFLSSFFIGHISDRWGRRPLILVGLLTSVIGTIGFAITNNFWIALAFRIFSGLTNGNIALCRAVITDVTTNAESRAMAFAYQGASFSVARALASGIGGLTAGINIFGYENKFFLPCFLGALFNLVTLFISWFYIPETLSAATRAKKHSLAHVFIDLGKGLKFIWSDKLLRKLIFVQGLNAYSNGALLLLLVLHCSLEIGKGGLNWSFLYTGLLYAWFGVCAVVFQLIVYKRAHQRYSLTTIYRSGCVCLGLACLAFPLPAMIFRREDVYVTTMNQIIVCFLMALVCLGLAAGFMTAMPVVGTMVSNACDPNRQGLTLGTTQSIQSLLRGLGPLTAGTFFTATSDYALPQIPFICLALVNLICFCIMSSLTPEQHEIIKAPKKKTNIGIQQPASNHVTISPNEFGSPTSLYQSTSYQPPQYQPIPTTYFPQPSAPSREPSPSPSKLPRAGSVRVESPSIQG